MDHSKQREAQAVTGEECGTSAEALVPRGARDPGQPTAEERRLHELTHCPFRSWCDACVKGQAKNAPSRKIQGEFAESAITRVRMDYAFITEGVEEKTGEHGESTERTAKESMTVLVMQESRCRSVRCCS